MHKRHRSQQAQKSPPSLGILTLLNDNLHCRQHNHSNNYAQAAP